jgi:hypothetical protein
LIEEDFGSLTQVDMTQANEYLTVCPLLIFALNVYLLLLFQISGLLAVTSYFSGIYLTCKQFQTNNMIYMMYFGVGNYVIKLPCGEKVLLF